MVTAAVTIIHWKYASVDMFISIRTPVEMKMTGKLNNGG
jgi:hypothetical protein